jgi:excisionase family DNA binding protein
MSARLDAAVAELVAALRAEMAIAPSSAAPELLDVSEAARRAGIGRTLMYGLIRRGTVRSVRMGRRRLIPADALDVLATNEGATVGRGSALEVDRRDRSTPPAAA